MFFQELAEQHGIAVMPTFICFKNGEKVYWSPWPKRRVGTFFLLHLWPKPGPRPWVRYHQFTKPWLWRKWLMFVFMLLPLHSSHRWLTGKISVGLWEKSRAKDTTYMEQLCFMSSFSLQIDEMSGANRDMLTSMLEKHMWKDMHSPSPRFSSPSTMTLLLSCMFGALAKDIHSYLIMIAPIAKQHGKAAYKTRYVVNHSTNFFSLSFLCCLGLWEVTFDSFSSFGCGASYLSKHNFKNLCVFLLFQGHPACKAFVDVLMHLSIVFFFLVDWFIHKSSIPGRRNDSQIRKHFSQFSSSFSLCLSISVVICLFASFFFFFFFETFKCL